MDIEESTNATYQSAMENNKKTLRRTAIIVDFSENLNERDYKPSRVVCILETLLVN